MRAMTLLSPTSYSASIRRLGGKFLYLKTIQSIECRGRKSLACKEIAVDRSLTIACNFACKFLQIEGRQLHAKVASRFGSVPAPRARPGHGLRSGHHRRRRER